MHRWTARFLLLALLLPAFGPLALASASQPEAMHCVRKPLQSSELAMHCHHGPQAPNQPGQETTIHSVDCCCQNHDCCRSLKTSEWARPAGSLLSDFGNKIESVPVTQFAAFISTHPDGQDSTRAPPIS